MVFLFSQFIISVVMLALATANASAGYYGPAAVDLSHGAWGAPAWGAAHWGGPWGGPAAWGYGPYGPSLTQSWGHLGAPYAGPYAGAPYAGPYGPTTAVHADPVHGHDGCVITFHSSVKLLS